MVQQQTMLNVADNTGAKKIMVIRVLGGSRRRFGKIGDMVAESKLRKINFFFSLPFFFFKQKTAYEI